MIAYAVVGSHRKIYVTELSPHEETIGRLQIYLREKDALKNADAAHVVKVRIIVSRKRKP